MKTKHFLCQFLLLLLALTIPGIALAAGTVQVKGYYRKDGTSVFL
jgi:hypothetical protein